MGKLICLLLGDATSTQFIEWEEDIEVLPSLKIQGSWRGDLGNPFSRFFVTGSEDFKDVGLTRSRGFQ